MARNGGRGLGGAGTLPTLPTLPAPPAPPPVRLLTADRGDAGRRLDLVLRRHLQDVPLATRTRVQSWIESGFVRVNGIVVRRVSSRAAQGDLIAIALPGAAQRRPMGAEELPLDVLYEDEWLVAINKPAGAVVHPTYKHTDGTIMNALLWRARGWPSEQRPSIVGRLDKLTSGVLLAAKSAAAHAALQRAMASPAARKEYLAVVYGAVGVARGRITAKLKVARDWRRVVVSEAGAESETRFERLARAAAPRAGVALLRCRLVTGRRHQIRVHLASRGWPIVGDPIYGEPRWEDIRDPNLAAALRAFPRQALHAWRLTVTHPATGRPLVIEAPLAEDLTTLIDRLGVSAAIDRR